MNKTIVFAWELGANLGHIDRLKGIADAMRAQGHRTVFLLRDLARSFNRLTAAGHEVMQAPIFLPRPIKPPRTSNYAGVLINTGWLDPASLAGLVRAWRMMFSALQPDLLLADHSPAALLAARGQGFKTCVIGNSWEIPPLREHFPAIRSWDRGERDLEKASDKLVRDAANRALAMLGDAPLERLTGLFDIDEKFLCSLPELLHYDGYPDDITLWGPSFVGDVGDEPVWPACAGPRTFCYLSPEHPDFQPVVKALAALSYPSLVYAKGISGSFIQDFADSSVHFTTQPLKMDSVTRDADIVVSHASLGTVTAATLGGCVQLGIPTHTEQFLVGRRIELNGTGLAVPMARGGKPFDFRHALQRLGREAGFARKAKEIADRHPGVHPDQTTARILARCQQLLADETMA